MSKAVSLMEAITQEIVGFLMTDHNTELEAAMSIFYNSSLYVKLHDEETGLYLEGSAYVYELFKDEFAIKPIQ